MPTHTQTRRLIHLLLVLTIGLFAVACDELVPNPEGETIDGPLTLGAAASPLNITATYANAPEQDLASLGVPGHVNVIEFWATWCGPCIKAMPHLNDLIAEFDGRPISFIGATYEDPQTVQNFLKKTRFDAIVVQVPDKTFEKYGATSIPLTVIIDADGKVAKVTRPFDLTADHLIPLIEKAEAKAPETALR